ncbi:hypothetical protein J4468_04390 [Candidatus Woesearchaeota archaeon]|nr:hypothetical protein [Candidatus Woesearchaeota archaeon]
MSEKKILDKMKIKYKGVFDLSELYKIMWIWLGNNGYDWHETEYADKQVGPTVKQVEIKWRGEKTVSDYVDHWLYIDMFIMLSDAEIEKDGVKIKTNSGEIEFRITAIVETDYMNEWTDKPLTRFLRDWYDRFIIKGRLEETEQELWDDAQDFAIEVKAFLDLYQY